ncbi:MAG: histidinol-phosphatase [Spirochaetia bacterium]|nr:histidinol-phosphatase [Spirochaetia bacterium]
MESTRAAESFLLRILPEVRKIVLKYYDTSLEIELKKDLSPVTIADREVENYIRDQIQQTFPDHGMIGEEGGDYLPEAQYKWIIDPIDGTKSFISHAPLFGTLIALCHNEKPVLGCIFLPATNDVLMGNNEQTFLNGKPVQMSQEVELKEALLLTTDYKDFSRYKKRDGFDRLMDQCRISRTWGDCFGYYLVATGKAQIMIDPAMSVWDKMALIPVIRGAGGAISDFYGNPPESGDSIVACVKSLHREVIQILNS